jgi:hypothetical protein
MWPSNIAGVGMQSPFMRSAVVAEQHSRVVDLL